MEDRRSSREQAEFLAEAQELLERLGDDLQKAEAEAGRGPVSIQRLNGMFRAIHSLKGLAGMMGRSRLVEFTHHLEDYMDRLRMGQVEMNPQVVNLLFEAHEHLERLVEGRPVDEPALGVLEGRIGGPKESAQVPAAAADPDALAGLDPRIRNALTRFEEHRLRENLQEGREIFLVHVSFSLDTFDTELRELIEKLNSGGEVLSTLPSMSAEEVADRLAFVLLLATAWSEEQVKKEAGRPVVLERWVGTRAEPPVNPAAPAPAAAGSQEEDGAVDGPAWLAMGSVRVDLKRLDRIMNSVGELVLFRKAIGSVARKLLDREGTHALGRDLDRSTRDLDKRIHELQKSVIGARMVPMSQIVGRLSRLVRKVSAQAGKKVVLVARGERTELDKVMIDRLFSPLIHLVRNAIDHGIEPPAVRRAAGKNETGTLELSAIQGGNSVLVTLADDGRGLDVEAVRQVAVRQGILAADTEVDLEVARELIFQPGFSSAVSVDEVSGRGFGLDVVRRDIASLSGSVRLTSQPGQGTCVELELPITLAIIQCTLIGAGPSMFAVPVTSLVETLRFRPGRLETIAGSPVIRLRGEILPLVDLRTYSRLGHQASGGLEFVVVARCGEKKLALGVETLSGQQEVVIKPVDSRLENIPGLAGATEIGENQTALVLDVTSLGADVRTLSGAA
ncbi:MAG: chemotaxis protein CheA [Acidobacteriota bacterium]